MLYQNSSIIYNLVSWYIREKEEEIVKLPRNSILIIILNKSPLRKEILIKK